MAEKLKKDLKSKDVQVRKLEDANYGLEVKIKEREVKNKNLQEKIKELEAQLLVESKLARQHVDSRIAEQLAAKILCTHNSQSESKDQTNIFHLSVERDKFTLCPLPLNGYAQKNVFVDKENNPEIAEQLHLPKQMGRVSLCPTIQKISATSTLRCHSLIPQPSLQATTNELPPSFLPLTPIQANEGADGGFKMTSLPEYIPCDSPKDKRDRSKKVSSALRRSLHKKINVKYPLQPPLRRIGVNIVMEKMRVSIGGRGRVLLGNARRVVKDTRKQSQSEKERRWNIGTTVVSTPL